MRELAPQHKQRWYDVLAFCIDDPVPDRVARALKVMVAVAVAGCGQEPDRVNAIDPGLDYHFVKPADTRKLEAVLSTITGGTTA